MDMSTRLSKLVGSMALFRIAQGQRPDLGELRASMRWWGKGLGRGPLATLNNCATVTPSYVFPQPDRAARGQALFLCIFVCLDKVQFLQTILKGSCRVHHAPGSLLGHMTGPQTSDEVHSRSSDYANGALGQALPPTCHDLS